MSTYGPQGLGPQCLISFLPSAIQPRRCDSGRHMYLQAEVGMFCRYKRGERWIIDASLERYKFLSNYEVVIAEGGVLGKKTLQLNSSSSSRYIDVRDIM